jgi:hypothetical protein
MLWKEYLSGETGGSDLGQPRNSQRYSAKRSDETQRLVATNHVLVRCHLRYGYLYEFSICKSFFLFAFQKVMKKNAFPWNRD